MNLAHRIVLLSASVAVLLSAVSGELHAQGTRPNIIYLMTDDQRPEGLGITDPFGEVVTPSRRVVVDDENLVT